MKKILINMKKIFFALFLCLPIYMIAQNTPQYVGLWSCNDKVSRWSSIRNDYVDNVSVRLYLNILFDNEMPIVRMKEVENGGYNEVWYIDNIVVSTYNKNEIIFYEDGSTWRKIYKVTKKPNSDSISCVWYPTYKDNTPPGKGGEYIMNKTIPGW